MAATLREASAAFLVGLLDVNRTAMLHELERLMEEDAVGWERRAGIFAELLQRWPTTTADDDGGVVERLETVGVVRLCCSWIRRWPWDKRAARLVVEKMAKMGDACGVEEVHGLLAEKEFRAIVEELGEASHR